MKRFAEDANAKLTVLRDGEHFFHTGKELGILREWLQENMID